MTLTASMLLSTAQEDTILSASCGGFASVSAWLTAARLQHDLHIDSTPGQQCCSKCCSIVWCALGSCCLHKQGLRAALCHCIAENDSGSADTAVYSYSTAGQQPLCHSMSTEHDLVLQCLPCMQCTPLPEAAGATHSRQAVTGTTNAEAYV
eukprot:13501-Heterococcus_DN1.PRE.3